MGACYIKGSGVKKNNEVAVNCFRQGAAKSCMRAELELGKCLKDGIGTEENKTESFRIFKGLSKAGNIDALSEMSWCLLSGNSVTMSHEAFYMARGWTSTLNENFRTL